ncbi:DUF2127 domain-containing protein [Actinokineospora auranticolor]|uniref:DUF2127 domain-containing protein n=1 Tax=Actinokineospora auranticolor TaxID=155976 RepID=UPI001FEC79F8|nr:DUF2127 domain-containing protein [Actinokineospora auranticolor]
MCATKANKTQETLFRYAVLLKGIDGGGQLLAGLALALIPPTVITGVVHAIITRDLIGDGTLAHHLTHAAQDFTDGGTKTFAIIYLILHGLIKLALVIALMKHYRRAYPVAAVVLGLFVAYEIYRAIDTGSIVLPIFALLDVVVIYLVIREYRLT